MVSTDGANGARDKSIVKVALTAMAGTSIEWYDFFYLRNRSSAGVSTGVLLERIVANGGADCVLRHVRRWFPLASDGRGDLRALRRPRWPVCA